MGNCVENESNNHSTFSNIPDLKEKSKQMNKSNHMIKIQCLVRKFLAKRRIRKLLYGLWATHQDNFHYKKVSFNEIANIRPRTLELIEQQFDEIHNTYNYREAFQQEKSIDFSLFTIDLPAYRINNDSIYQGSWKYEWKKNKFLPYGRGEIIKQSGVKIISYFTPSLTPVAKVSRILYPNGRIYQGYVVYENEMYLADGKGKLFLGRNNYFLMRFNKGSTDNSEFTFYDYENDQIVKGILREESGKIRIVNQENNEEYEGEGILNNKNFLRHGMGKVVKNGKVIEEGIYENDILVKPIKSSQGKLKIDYEKVLQFLNYDELQKLHNIKSKIFFSFFKKRYQEIIYKKYTETFKNNQNIKVFQKRNSVILPFSSYETNGGLCDFYTHYSNIFNPDKTKVYFSNFCLDNNESNIFINAFLNKSFISTLSKDYPNQYKEILEKYLFNYNSRNIYDENIIKEYFDKNFYFIINSFEANFNLNPEPYFILTNPVKNFEVYITDDVNKKISYIKQEKLSVVHEVTSYSYKLYEYNPNESNGLLFRIEIINFPCDINYICKKKWSYAGQKVSLLLIDQHKIKNSFKKGIDFGTILFKGKILSVSD